VRKDKEQTGLRSAIYINIWRRRSDRPCLPLADLRRFGILFVQHCAETFV